MFLQLDSFLGATVQQTKFSESKKLILQDNSTPTGSLKVISGMNILTNNQVGVRYIFDWMFSDGTNIPT